MKATPTPTEAGPNFLRPRTVVLVLLVLGYAWLLRLYISPYAGGSDSSGYLNSAAYLLKGQLSATKPTLAGYPPSEFAVGAHQPLGFVTRVGTDEMAPSYPIGLPLHLAAFAWVAGLDWATIPVNICAALASGLLCYALARRLGLPAGFALGGAAVLLFCPLFLFAATQPMSDLLALTWTLAALYAALRAQEGWRWPLGCGIAIAMAVLVRPTDLLVVFPVMIALGWNWRAYLWVGLGGLPGAILQAWYNHAIYGAAFATGYGNVWSAFSPEFAEHNFPFFVRWIPGLLTPLVLAVLLAPFRAAARRREVLVLGAWAVILIGFYGYYYHSGETWWYLRFILPAFPALVVISLVVLHSFPALATRRAALIALLVGALGWELVLCDRFSLIHNKSGEATYVDAAMWGRKNFPANAAIICMQVSGALYYYTDFLLVRYEQVDLSRMPALIAALREARRPVYAILYDFEEAEAQARMGGHWKKLTKVRNATIWQVDFAPAR